MKHINSIEKSRSVAVVGARGYSGLEVSRLLLKHPSAELRACFATTGFQLGDHLPNAAAARVPALAMDELLPMVRAREIGTVFLATPTEVSLELAPRLLEFGVDVIDLSGAFRLSEGSNEAIRAQYKIWYQIEHAAPALVKEAEYGLVPWVEERKRSGPALIANPGCFATAISLGLAPLLKRGLIEPESLVIDAKSGTTGAGRKAEERLLHAEVDGLCLPYRIGRHQHMPEVAQFIARETGVSLEPHFTTHLLNVRRGIIAGLYANVAKGRTSEDIAQAYRTYSRDPLITAAELTNENEARILNLRRVVGTARTQIGYRLMDRKLYVFSLIDNLMKGAASQAIENFNRLQGLPTWTGLTEVEGVI